MKPAIRRFVMSFQTGQLASQNGPLGRVFDLKSSFLPEKAQNQGSGTQPIQFYLQLLCPLNILTTLPEHHPFGAQIDNLTKLRV